MTYLDTRDQTKVDADLAKIKAAPADSSLGQMLKYANGDPRFALYLAYANQRCMRKLGLGIFDLADYQWRDAYTGGTTPTEAVQEMLENDDTYSMFMDAE